MEILISLLSVVVGAFIIFAFMMLGFYFGVKQAVKDLNTYYRLGLWGSKLEDITRKTLTGEIRNSPGLGSTTQKSRSDMSDL